MPMIDGGLFWRTLLFQDIYAYRPSSHFIFLDDAYDAIQRVNDAVSTLYLQRRG